MSESAVNERATAVRVLDRVASIVEAFVVAAIAFNIVMTFTNTMLRYITNQDFPWATDAWAILISIITFLGAPSYFRRTTGMAYTALIDQTGGLKKQSLQACGLAIFLGICLVALVAYPSFFAGPARPDAGGTRNQHRLRRDLARHRPRAARDLHDREARGARPARDPQRLRRGGRDRRVHVAAALGLRPGPHRDRSVRADPAGDDRRVHHRHAGLRHSRARRHHVLPDHAATRRSWSFRPRCNTASRASSCSPFRSSWSPAS